MGIGRSCVNDWSESVRIVGENVKKGRIGATLSVIDFTLLP